MLPLKVVELMVILLSFAIDSPPGPIQWIITEFNLTPLTVLTIHWISCGLSTIAPCMGPYGNVVIIGTGTIKISLIYYYNIATTEY